MLRGRKAALTRGYGCESVDERHCSQCFLRCSRYRDLRSAVRTSSSVRRYVGGSASRMRCPLRGRRTCTIASERCCSFDINASTVESQPRMSATACSDGPSRGARAEARYSLPHSSCPEAIASLTNLWRYLVRTQVCRARSHAPLLRVVSPKLSWTEGASASCAVPRRGHGPSRGPIMALCAVVGVRCPERRTDAGPRGDASDRERKHPNGGRPNAGARGEASIALGETVTRERASRLFTPCSQLSATRRTHLSRPGERAARTLVTARDGRTSGV